MRTKTINGILLIALEIVALTYQGMSCMTCKILFRSTG
jgi:hypothetical protein